MASLPFFLNLPCTIRDFVDKRFIDEWISLQLIVELGSDYATVAFDLYYWLFNKKYEADTIDLTLLHKSLTHSMGDRVVSSTSIMKGLERILLLDYLGEVTQSEKEQVRRDLDLKIIENNLKHTIDTEKITKLKEIARASIDKVNRHECFDYIGSQLRSLVSGDDFEILQLRVMGNIYSDETEGIDMNVLANKLQKDLGPHCGVFVSRLQHFLLTKCQDFNEKPQGLLL
ncbi:LAQU0S12e00232g1_1 [Lachancea quebecensis]|uniref:LAQU0S12e00232g1_1 n=1 Tax=Lachancea quebecensis TaxID=1654605 RepID=A0A0P1KV24_9SACH|nr:LAQU0S12e00232g1_1 [Lachancea quebecensis]